MNAAHKMPRGLPRGVSLNLILLVLFLAAVGGGIVWLTAFFEASRYETDGSLRLWCYVLLAFNIAGAVMYLVLRRPEAIREWGQSGARQTSYHITGKLLSVLAVFYTGCYCLYFFFAHFLPELPYMTEYDLRMIPALSVLLFVSGIIRNNFPVLVPITLPLLWGMYFVLLNLRTTGQRRMFRALVWAPSLFFAVFMFIVGIAFLWSEL